MELPGINYKFNAKKYRYFYGLRLEWSPQPNKVKHRPRHQRLNWFVPKNV